MINTTKNVPRPPVRTEARNYFHSKSSNNAGYRGKQPMFAFRRQSKRAGGGEPRHEPEPIEIHELAKIVPEMSARRYQELREDIREKGQLEPIILYEGKVLDGRHRDRACRELGLSRKIETYKGTDPAGFVLSKNAMRRDLSDTQRAKLVAKLRLPQWKAEAKERQVASLRKGDEIPVVSKPTQRERTREIRTWEKVAKEAGVSQYKARKAVEAVERESREPTRKPKPVADKLDPIYISRKFGQFLRHWPSHSDQRRVREHLFAYLKP